LGRSPITMSREGPPGDRGVVGGGDRRSERCSLAGSVVAWRRSPRTPAGALRAGATGTGASVFGARDPAGDSGTICGGRSRVVERRPLQSRSGFLVTVGVPSHALLMAVFWAWLFEQRVPCGTRVLWGFWGFLPVGRSPLAPCEGRGGALARVRPSTQVLALAHPLGPAPATAALFPGRARCALRRLDGCPSEVARVGWWTGRRWWCPTRRRGLTP